MPPDPPDPHDPRPDPILISTDPALIDLQAVHGFLSTCYWSPGIDRSRLERGIRNSLNFGVYDTSLPRQAAPTLPPLPTQAGFARVVTDRATYAYLCDVFVLDAWRGRGIGKRLMETIVAHPDLRGLRRFCLTTRDAHGLYARYRFAPMADPTRYMEVVDRESYRRA